uniref:Uncharacterized protein n=1 Tax=Petromyzon marinus TaxID=7757 RepID=S4RXR5_PETMA
RGRQWPKETAKDQQQQKKQASSEMEKQEKKTRKEMEKQEKKISKEIEKQQKKISKAMEKQEKKTRKEREKQEMKSALTLTSVFLHVQDNREKKAKLTTEDLNPRKEKARKRRRIEATSLRLWRIKQIEKEQNSEREYYIQMRRMEIAQLRKRREKKAAKKKRRQEMGGKEVSRSRIMMRMSLWWSKLSRRSENNEAEQDSQVMKAVQETPGKCPSLMQDMKVQRAKARNRRRIEAARIRRWRIKQLPKEQQEEKASRLKTGEKVASRLKLRLEKKAAMKKRHQEKEEEVASGSLATFSSSKIKSHEEEAGRGRQWPKETAKDQQQQKKQASSEMEKQEKKTRKEMEKQEKKISKEIEKQEKKTRKEREKQQNKTRKEMEKQGKKSRKEREKQEMKSALTLTSVFLHVQDNREKKAKLTTEDLNPRKEKARKRRRIEATSLRLWRIKQIEKEQNSEREYYIQMRRMEIAQLRKRREKKAAKKKRRQEMGGKEVSRSRIMMRMSLWWSKLSRRSENNEAEQDSQVMKAVQETPGKCPSLMQDMKVQRAKARNRRRIEAARIRRWRIKQLPKEQQEEKASRLKTGKKVASRLKLRLEKKAAMKKRHQEKEEEVASGSLATFSSSMEQRRIGDLMVEMKSHEEEAGRGRQWPKETAKDQQQQKKQASSEMEKQEKKTRKEMEKQEKKISKEIEKQQKKISKAMEKQEKKTRKEREKQEMKSALTLTSVFLHVQDNREKKAKLTTEDLNPRLWRIKQIEKEQNSEREYYIQMRRMEIAQLRKRREKKAAKKKRRQEMGGKEVSRSRIMMRMSLWWNMKVQRAKARNRRRIEAARIRRWRIKQLPKEQQEEKASRLKTGKKVASRLKLRLEKKAAMKKRHQEKE